MPASWEVKASLAMGLPAMATASSGIVAGKVGVIDFGRILSFGQTEFSLIMDRVRLRGRAGFSNRAHNGRFYVRINFNLIKDKFLFNKEIDYNNTINFFYFFCILIGWMFYLFENRL